MTDKEMFEQDFLALYNYIFRSINKMGRLYHMDTEKLMEHMIDTLIKTIELEWRK